MNNLILLGAGGHCKSTIEVLKALRNNFCIKGILDHNMKGNVSGYPILGDDNLIGDFANENLFLITIGSIKSTKIREMIATKVVNSGGSFATVISPKAIVSETASIGCGTIIFNSVCLNVDSVIGKNCIINTACNIEHDCIVGNFVHISTGVMINGGCKIGNNCFIGSNSTLIQGINICNDVVIGAGSVVIKNILESGIYVGNPARKIK